MWLVKRSSERVGARLVRYFLFFLIIFAMLAIILSIILVTFDSSYSSALNDRAQGILIILLLILLNYAAGFFALLKEKSLLLFVFGLTNFGLAGLCLASTNTAHRHIGNWGALVLFIASGLLTTLVIWQRALQSAPTVNCFHHIDEDWYDCGTSSMFLSEKDELIPTSQLLPYNCVALDEELQPVQCTVETSEPNFWKGDSRRYAV